MACCCHFQGTKSFKLQKLTAQTAAKLYEYAAQWVGLKKEPEASLCKPFVIPGSENSDSDNHDNNNNTTSSPDEGHEGSTTTTIHTGDQYIHQSCYSRITSTHKLDQAKKAYQEAITTTCEPPALKKLRSHAEVRQGDRTTPVLAPICVICSSETKFTYDKRSGRNKREPLMQAATLTAGKLKEAATRKGDERILVHLLTDPVASEMRYHSKCYKDYVRDMNEKPRKLMPSGLDDDLDPCFCSEVVDQRLIAEKEYMSLKSLLSIHQTYSATITRTDKLKRSLQKKYPSQLRFDRPKARNQSELVHSSEVSFADVADVEVADAGMTDDSSVESDWNDDEAYRIAPCTNEVFHGSMLIRRSIDDHQYTSVWPPTAETLTQQQAETSVPALLYNAIAIITGITDAIPDNSYFIADIESRIHCKLLSITQDIVNLRNKGRNPTPKALSLGMTLKHLTGSAHVLKLMSSFGHCSSYDTVNRMETAIALNHIENPQHIPPGFQPGLPTVLVFDNIDFCEETLSGSGSTHHVNGIMFQADSSNSPTARIEQHLQSTPISKRPRSVNPPALILEPFVLGQRKGTQITENLDLQCNTYDAKAELLSQSILHEFAYLAIKKETTIPKPAWTGFNKTNTKAESLLSKSNLSYLNVIEASPNDSATISHVLKLSVEKADYFQLDCITVIFDQALYSKAQQIRWKNPTFQNCLVLRMGEFHTCMAFLGTIGKLYKLSGFEDILVESEVLAGGSANGVLSGHMYNRSLRCHKLLYEALGRLQIEAFLETNPDIRSDYTQILEQMLYSSDDLNPSDLANVYKEF